MAPKRSPDESDLLPVSDHYIQIRSDHQSRRRMINGTWVLYLGTALAHYKRPMCAGVLQITKERAQRPLPSAAPLSARLISEPGCKRFALFFILAHLHSSGSAGKPKGSPPTGSPPSPAVRSTNPGGSLLASLKQEINLLPSRLPPSASPVLSFIP